MPRLFRESPLNAIWEGSGNVIALDVLRTLEHEPAALEAFRAEIAPARGAEALFDAAADRALDGLAAAPVSEAGARCVAERLALLLQGALLLRHGTLAVASGFVRARLGPDRAACYGALPAGIDVSAILRRQTEV